MPRKRKLDKDDVTPSATTEPQPEPTSDTETKPASRRAKKAAAVPEAVVQVAEAVSEPQTTTPARSRSRKQSIAPKAEPEPVVPAPTQTPHEEPTEAPKPGRSGRSRGARKPATEEPALEAATPPADASAQPESAQAPKQDSRRRTRGGRGAKKPAAPDADQPQPEAPQEETAPTAATPSEEEPKRGRNRRRGRGRTEPESPAPQATASAEDTSADEDEDLPVPIWRPRQKSAPDRQEAKAATKPAAPAPPSEEESEEHGGEPEHKKGRRRRGRSTKERPEAPTPEPETSGGTRRPITTPQPVAGKVDFAKPALKPLIPVPEEAPQVVLREGIPTLVRNGRVYPPVFFFGNPADERRARTVLEEVKMAAEAGVHLHAYLTDLEVDRDSVDDAVAFAAFMLKKSVEVDPEAQVLFRVVFQAPRGWQDRYPNARYRMADGSWAEPSVADDEFWNEARHCLELFVKKLCLLDLRENILGIHLDRGEWFLAEDAGYDDSTAAQAKFREWARTRYVNDEVTLRASWFDGQVRFASVQVPDYLPEGLEGEKFIRSSRRQRRYVDYHLFLSDATVHRIGELAYVAKEASKGMFLVGASYGYTFEWSHPSSGHLSLGKLLRTPEVDFIAGPPSYRTREPGGAAAFPGPIDSFALNGKLYLSEEDFKTSLAIGHEPDDFNPQLRTPQALESVHWRGAGAALAHASGLSWMDLWGNGWLKTASVWDRARRVQEALVLRMQTPPTDPDVAVFIDERALAYLVEPDAFQLLVQNVRESVLRAGVSCGFYLLSDLAHREKFPESRLYLFLNAWDIRPELRAAIKSRLQRDNKVLFWLYSAGLFDTGRDSLERAREVTGIALKPQPFYSKSGTTILNKRHPLSEAFPDRQVIGAARLEPSYFAIPEGAVVLGEYTQTGLPSFVVKEFKDGPSDSHWTSVFLGEPLVNPALIRALAQMAGVHIWNFHDDVVHVRPPFCTVHCTGPGSRVVALPNKYSAYNLLTREWVADSQNVRLNATDGSSHVLLVGIRQELEHLLSLDPSEALRMARLPARETNDRLDVSNFDVPIMRLDAWMESGEPDEVADEWFLRPPQIAEEEPAQAMESPERVGRRRRRRRGGRERGDGEEVRGTPVEPSEIEGLEDEFGIHVMFRRRD